MPHKNTVEHYDKQADEFFYRNANTIYDKEYDIFFNLLSKGSKLVDIGCGIGRDAKKLVGNYEYLGIDASKSMLEIARKNVKEGSFQLGDFYHLDFPQGAFDGFWAAASLLHVPKDEIVSVLKAIKGILKPQAIGFISLKLKDSLDEGVIKENKRGIATERYFAFYKEGEFDHFLNEAGFDVVEVTTTKENDERGQIWLCYFVKSN